VPIGSKTFGLAAAGATLIPEWRALANDLVWSEISEKSSAGRHTAGKSYAGKTICRLYIYIYIYIIYMYIYYM